MHHAMIAFMHATLTGTGLAVAQPAAEIETVRIPGSTVTFDLAPATTPDGTPIHALTTEVTWDLYDVFVYELDQPEEDAAAVDAVSRPSKPYVPPDRGMGHDGYPAMGMTLQAAREFCAWLSLKTGDQYRLPTQSEWQHLALAGSEAPYSFDEAIDELAAHGWTVENANYSTHPVGELPANGFGLFDMHGNVAEWVETEPPHDADPSIRPRPRPMAMGGSWRQPAEEATAEAAQRQASNWNASDPQIPKSVWWLADCSWVGFRFIREVAPAGDTTNNDEQPDSTAP